MCLSIFRYRACSRNSSRLITWSGLLPIQSLLDRVLIIGNFFVLLKNLFCMLLHIISFLSFFICWNALFFLPTFLMFYASNATKRHQTHLKTSRQSQATVGMWLCAWIDRVSKFSSLPFFCPALQSKLRQVDIISVWSVSLVFSLKICGQRTLTLDNTWPSSHQQYVARGMSCRRWQAVVLQRSFMFWKLKMFSVEGWSLQWL